MNNQPDQDNPSLPKANTESPQAAPKGEQNPTVSEQKTQNEPPPQPASSSGGLPFGIIAAAAAGWFLMGHKDQLGDKGGFIIVIGAIVLGVMSAGMLSKK